MKFTSFHPFIMTNSAETVIKVFEELGFKQRHTITSTALDLDIQTVCMKNPDGFGVDVAQVDNIQQDTTVIRMNVDNFEEAYKFLIDRGFTNPNGTKTTDNPNTKTCLMYSPSGFAFELCQHSK